MPEVFKDKVKYNLHVDETGMPRVVDLSTKTAEQECWIVVGDCACEVINRETIKRPCHEGLESCTALR